VESPAGWAVAHRSLSAVQGLAQPAGAGAEHTPLQAGRLRWWGAGRKSAGQLQCRGSAEPSVAAVEPGPADPPAAVCT